MQHRPAQFAEETKRADKNVAYGLIAGTIWEAVMGLAFGLVLPVLYAGESFHVESLGSLEPMSLCTTLHLITLCIRELLSLACDTCLYSHATFQQGE